MGKRIICALFFLSHTLIGMINQPREERGEKTFSSQEIVLDLITLYYLDHKSICNFGATSKNNDDFMISLAEKRKKIVGNIPEIAQSSLQAWHYDAWHKYGSAYRCIYIRSYAEQILHAKSYELSLSLPIKPKSYIYDISIGERIQPLPCKILPYYNGGDKDYFYGILTRVIPYSYRMGSSGIYKSVSICRFAFNQPGLECRISSQGASWGLRNFLDYPVILQAILNSKVVSKKKTAYINVHGRRNKRTYWDYSLEGITIPENYQQYIKDTDSTRETARWNILNESLKKTIEMRYQEQQKQGKLKDQ